jgi:hypothetical protein
MNEEISNEKSGSGCLKVGGIGCAVVLGIMLIAGLWLYAHREKLLRSFMSKSLTVGAEAMVEALQLPPEEREAAMQPLLDLSEEIGQGTVSAEQGARIMQALIESVVPNLLAMRAFEVQLMQKGDLSAQEKEEARKTIWRYAEGLRTKTIDDNSFEDLMNIVSTPQKEGRRLKDDITPEDFRRCLAIMKKSADEGGVADRQFEFDLPGEIRKAIDAGLAAESEAPAR